MGRKQAKKYGPEGPFGFYSARALILADNLDIFLAAVFLERMFFATPRINSGCATLYASAAAFASPPLIAASTFFTHVRMRLLRDVLISLRRALVRILFFAEAWFAIFLLS